METTESTVLVEYLGHKDRKEDNVSGSNAVWHGHGDVQPVTAAQWGALSKHHEVWRKVKGSKPEPKKSEPVVALSADATKAGQAAKALGLDEKTADQAAAMTVEQVHAFKFDLPEVGKEAKPAAKTAKKGAK